MDGNRRLPTGMVFTDEGVGRSCISPSDSRRRHRTVNRLAVDIERRQNHEPLSNPKTGAPDRKVVAVALNGP